MGKLFSELKIGAMIVKNRTFMAPMSLGYESQDGTLDNRARLLLEIISAVKDKCGKDFPIILRMSGN